VNSKLVEEIANAVLYEGYMLYPYRASSVKNRQRWNFGVVYPRNYSEIQKGTDPWRTQTECLVSGVDETEVRIKVRFLQAISRVGAGAEKSGIEEAENIGAKLGEGPNSVSSEQQGAWQEAAEREVVIEVCPIDQLLNEPVTHLFTLAPSRAVEEICDGQGRVVATMVRTQEPISGRLTLSAEELGPNVYKVTLTVANESELPLCETATRDRAVMQSLLSAHSILSVEQGEFVSLLETPDEFREFAGQCKNVGTWPVLVGEEGQPDTMLSSPIILYDYPQIAPESPGNLFDGTEIDEILALRILTLTDEEKREMRDGDARARQILERTEALPEEQFLKLHGVLRGMRPTSGDHR
jgi:hypothetical protein